MPMQIWLGDFSLISSESRALQYLGQQNVRLGHGGVDVFKKKRNRKQLFVSLCLTIEWEARPFSDVVGLDRIHQNDD